MSLEDFPVMAARVVPELAAVLNVNDQSLQRPEEVLEHLSHLTLDLLEEQGDPDVLMRCFDVLEAVLEAGEASAIAIVDQVVTERLRENHSLRSLAAPYMGTILGGRSVNHDDLIWLAGGRVDEFRMRISISGFSLVPEEITSRLQIEPTDAHRRGEKFGKPNTNMRRKRGYWAVSIEGTNSDEVDELLNRLLDRLPDPHKWQDTRSAFDCHLSFGIFLEEWNRAFDLSQETVARMSALGLSASFDIYGPTKDDDDQEPI